MADPLKITIALADEHQGNAPGPRNDFRDFRRAQMRWDRRRAYASSAGGAFRGLTNTPIGASDLLATGVEAAAGHLKAIGATIPVAGAGLVAAGALGEHAAGASRRLDEMAERYGKYSPEIATARAEARAKQIEFEVEQAQKYGPQLAEWVRAQSDLSRSFEGAQTGILTKAAPNLITVLEKFAEALNKLDPANLDPQGFIDSMKKMFSAEKAEKAAAEDIEKHKQEFEEAAGKKKEGRLLGDFLDALKGAGGVPLAKNGADAWMEKNDQFELADLGMNLNGIIEKEVGKPAQIFRGA